MNVDHEVSSGDKSSDYTNYTVHTRFNNKIMLEYNTTQPSILDKFNCQLLSL